MTRCEDNETFKSDKKGNMSVGVSLFIAGGDRADHAPKGAGCDAERSYE